MQRQQKGAKEEKKKKTHMRVCTLRRATTHGWHHCFRCSSHKIRTAPTTEIDECAFLLFRTTSRSAFPDDRVSICLCESVYYSLCVCVCALYVATVTLRHIQACAHTSKTTQKKRNTLFFFSLLPCAVFYPHFIFVVCVFSLVFVVYVRQKKKKTGREKGEHNRSQTLSFSVIKKKKKHKLKSAEWHSNEAATNNSTKKKKQDFARYGVDVNRRRGKRGKTTRRKKKESKRKPTEEKAKRSKGRKRKKKKTKLVYFGLAGCCFFFSPFLF